MKKDMIKNYIPNFKRKPNLNFNYNKDKIQKITENIQPVKVKYSDIPTFKNTQELKQWVNNIFANNRNIVIKSDKEKILGNYI